MIVAVTGATGFIGKKLLERLIERGDVVRVLTRQPASIKKSPLLEIYECDLLTISSSDLAAMLLGVEVLYHCAGQLRNEHSMRSLHVEATKKLIEAASSAHIGHWVQLSSVGVYGPRVRGAVTEATAPDPSGEYETTKYEADLIVLDAAQSGRFGCSILRPSNVFGARMKNRSLYSLIDMIRRGWFFFIGKPGAKANYIHVSNVVEALLMCGTMPQAVGQTYNLSDWRTMEQFVSIIAALTGRAVPVIRLPEWPIRMVARLLGKLPGFPLTEARVNAMTGRATYSTEKIEHELGYVHQVSMEAGLKELVSFWQGSTEK